MSFLKKIFSKDEPIKSNQDFWNWFVKNEKTFFNVVKGHKNIEKDFFNKLAPRLNELKDGYFFLTGMLNDNIAELILTADGRISNLVFVEELVNAAPQINNWKFTAHKPSLDIKDVNIEMNGYRFDAGNMFFYSNDVPSQPDEIDVAIIHNDLTEKNRSEISNGIYVFLDNYLGELDFAITIDNLTIERREIAKRELIPIEKLKSYLIWRQKEFVEKYEGVRYDTDNDNYSTFEAKLENRHPLLAVINNDLLNWNSKASHPWMVNLEMKFGEGNSGMPGDKAYQLMNTIEDKIMEHLKDSDGYLNVGRETGAGKRNVYFACREFRKPSKVLQEIKTAFMSDIDVAFDIYKDKYWQTFNKFARV